MADRTQHRHSKSNAIRASGLAGTSLLAMCWAFTSFYNVTYIGPRLGIWLKSTGASIALGQFGSQDPWSGSPRLQSVEWAISPATDAPGPLFRMPDLVQWPDGSRYFHLPYWIVLAPMALLTCCGWLFPRQRKRLHCDRCGYSLIGNASGICPECGQPVMPGPLLEDGEFTHASRE